MEILFNNKRFVNVLIILFFSLALFLLGLFFNGMKQYSFIGRDIPILTTINVSGEGEVYVKPDIAEFTFSVSNDAKTVADAQKVSTDKINAIISYLKEAKVDDKDIKTTDYSITPKYEYQNVTCLNGYCPNGNQVLVGYTVSQTVDVKVRTLADAGTILANIGSKGATNVSDLNFTVDDQKAVEANARTLAIQDAQKKADILAKSLGVALVRVTNFSEGQPVVPYFTSMKMESAGMGGAPVAAPSIPTGQNKVTSNVTITYEIQ
jgi:uncharacterized protein YggE